MAQTEIMQKPSTNASENIRNDIHRQAEADRQSQNTGLQGRLPIGEVIAGFTITGTLSFVGGEAEIYTCEKDGKRYALKYYYKLEKDTKLFEQLKNIKHPNIMQQVDYGVHKNNTYVILQFAEGGAISDKENNAYKYLPLSEKKAEEAVNEILESYKVIHAKGIIHRDIKPDNIFYQKAVKTEKWVGTGILLGDFGIASLFEADQGMTSNLTESDLGTEGYLAPETYAVGMDKDLGLVRKVSPAIDYWALGVTLWVLLTGKEPFYNEKDKKIIPRGEIIRNATNNETAKLLLARSPDISERMKKLIKGLLTARSKERWNYEKVKDHLAGKEVEVFELDARDMPVFVVGKTECYTWREIVKALLADPAEGKKIVFGKKLKDYMWEELVGNNISENAQADAERIDKIREDYSAQGKEDEGFYRIVYSLDPGAPFTVGMTKDDQGKDIPAEIKNREDINKILETDPDLLIPFLRDEKLGFYAYMANDYAQIAEKIREVVKTTRSNLKLIPRLQISLKNDIIAPFQDGVNNERKLKSIDQLEDLPDNLKERIVLFVEMKKDDITAWLETNSQKDMDIWIDKYINQKGKLISWGTWKYFSLFLKGRDIQNHKTFTTNIDGRIRYGLKNNYGEVILTPAWEWVNPTSPPDRYIVKRTDKWGVVKGGKNEEVLPIAYDLITVFDEEKGLYQCIETTETGKCYVLIDEEKKVLRKGSEPLKIATAQGKPFDVVYDSKYIYSENYKAVNKKGVRFAVIETGTENYIWMMEEGACIIYDSAMKEIGRPPYSDFRSGNKAVPVQKDGKWGVASADGKKEILDFTNIDIRKGGNYFAQYMPGGVGGKIIDFNNEGVKTERFWLKFDKEGGVIIMPAGGGNPIANFRSIINLGADYTNGAKDFAPNDKMAGFSSGELLYFDLRTGKTSKRDIVTDEEIPYILKHSSGMELYVVLQNLKKQGSIKVMNRIIDAAAELDENTNSSWAEEKGSTSWLMILNLLDETKKDGLANEWDIYLSWIGAEQLKGKKYAEAYNSFVQAINLSDVNAVYQAGCGAACYHLGDYKNALTFFTKAASMAVGVFAAQYEAARGSALYSLTKFNEAMAAFTNAISSAGAKTPAEFFTARAMCYLKLNMTDKARADQDKAAKSPNTTGEKIRGIPLPGQKF